jgi:hypothetical protein
MRRREFTLKARKLVNDDSPNPRFVVWGQKLEMKIIVIKQHVTFIFSARVAPLTFASYG